jgi:F-type H+-transporting ATPase subunit epsilon
MTTFTLHLQDAVQYKRRDDVTSFVGRDGSGSFGILPGHAPFMTMLAMGLARFQSADGQWHYLALPGGLVYFVGNQLYLSTRRYQEDTDYTRIASALEEQIRHEETALRGIKDSLRRLEEEMFKRLWRLGRKERPFS